MAMPASPCASMPPATSSGAGRAATRPPRRAHRLAFRHDAERRRLRRRARRARRDRGRAGAARARRTAPLDRGDRVRRRGATLRGGLHRQPGDDRRSDARDARRARRPRRRHRGAGTAHASAWTPIASTRRASIPPTFTPSSSCTSSRAACSRRPRRDRCRDVDRSAARAAHAPARRGDPRRGHADEAAP